ncbi:unnamed protein product [Fusarium venenatum]|uniref:Uncharacterized protein n=1 Tax=Fusarium venenatum TaxID=56646 RepID=A0A2L2TLS6_9HYPO|nr:uncharacterized protein FVRRES_05796 [Fusarium venenatum]CEI61360.1 unnamed protein product [Fusarium venenatum]
MSRIAASNYAKHMRLICYNTSFSHTISDISSNIEPYRFHKHICITGSNLDTRSSRLAIIPLQLARE